MKNENDKKIKEYKKNQLKKWILLTLYLSVIVLEILALMNIISMWWGVGVFALIYFIRIFKNK